MEKDIMIILKAFPSELQKDIRLIFRKISLRNKMYNGGNFEVFVDNELICIPERVYYEELNEDEEVGLSPLQKQILDCIFTRHHDGYIRQKRLNNIFESGKVFNWAIPYVIKLVGEYVLEILNDINNNIGLINQRRLVEFVRSNPRFILATESRIETYWGLNYRFIFKRDAYIGFKLKEYLQYLRRLEGNFLPYVP